MGRDDWYRNEQWTPEIESAFRVKLARARDKQQYLRIQAWYLAESHPEVALQLLDEYFSMGEYFDDAEAHLDRATALRALGKPEKAIEVYEAALQREREYPTLITEAYLDLPFTIATHGFRQHHQRALDVLGEYADRPAFPVQFFRWHAARALILADLDEPLAARDAARAALKAAGRDHSGFINHPALGLVGDEFMDLRARLEQLAADQPNQA